MKFFRSSILLLFLLLIGCSPASIDGKAHIKVNADGSGQYQFTLLTHPLTLFYFQKFKQSLIDQQFEVKEITREKQVGWIATKTVKDLRNESIPLSIPTFQQSIPKPPEKILQIDDGFYWKQMMIHYPLDLTQYKAPTLIANRIRLALVVTLPIPFQEQNATHLSSDQKTATWQLKVGQVNPIYAKVKVPNPKGWIITIAGVFIILILWIILLVRKKKATTY